LAAEVSDDALITPAQKEKTKSYLNKVQGIREMLCRDRMKVAFFGR
jgi:mitofusin